MKQFLLILFIIGLIGCNVNSESSLKQVMSFGDKENVSYVSLNNKNDTLFVSMFTKDEQNKTLFYANIYRDGKIVKTIQNATKAVFDVNGKFYAYIKEKTLYINDVQGKVINKIPVNDFIESLSWTYDSRYIYLCEQGQKYIIYRIEIEKGTKEVVLESKKVYFHPIPVKDSNVIYLLENRYPGDVEPDCFIIKYDLSTKTFESVQIPISYSIYEDFSISSDAKIVAFLNMSDAFIYIIDISKSKVLDKIKIPRFSHPNMYGWKVDGSYALFSFTLKDIYKYIIPKN